MIAGNLYAIAGDDTTGYAGDGGPGTSAELSQVRGMAIDSSGNVIFADGSNERIRLVAASSGTYYGQSMTADDIYTIAGDGTSGNTGNGGPATSAEIATDSPPTGVAVDGNGNVVLGENNFAYSSQGTDYVRVVAASSGTDYGASMTAGDIYAVAGNGYASYSGDGGPAGFSQMSSPSAVAVDEFGDVVISDSGNNRIRTVAGNTGTFYGQAMTQGDVYTIAGNGTYGDSGDGGAATSAEVSGPSAIAIDGVGNVLFSETDTDEGWNDVRVVAAQSGYFYGQTMTAGDIYTIAGPAGSGPPSYGDGGPATSATLSGPSGLAVDPFGNVIIADSGDRRVRVVAAYTGTFYGQFMTAGDIYTVAGGGSSSYTDGDSATSVALSPQSVAVDPKGNLVITDDGTNEVSVVAASTGTFYGQSMTAGDIYIIAGDGTYGYTGDGGPATSAEMDGPGGLQTDGFGDVVVTDGENAAVRVIAEHTASLYGQSMTAGDIYTVAGDGTKGFSGDGGPATSAELDEPGDVAVDGSGNLLITDSGTGRIRTVWGGETKIGRITGVRSSSFVPVGALPTKASSAGGGGGATPNPCGCGSGSQPSVGEPVNTATGEFWSAANDLSVPGAGIPLALTRTYSSVVAQDQAGGTAGPLGFGWSYNLGMTVSLASSTATVTWGDGAEDTFSDSSAGLAEPWCSGTNFCATSPRVEASLNENGDGSWTLVDHLSSATTYSFDSSGVLTGIEDAQGDTLTSSPGTPATSPCPATGAGSTCVIWTSSASDRELGLGFDSSGQLVAAQDQDGNAVTYTYGSGSEADNLMSVTDLDSLTSTFTYDSGNSTTMFQDDMLTETTPGTGTVTNTYDSSSSGSSGRITEQDLPTAGSSTGNVTTYAYSGSSYANDNGSEAGGTTTVTNYVGGYPSGSTVVDTYAYSSGVLMSKTVGVGSSDPVTTNYVRDPTTLLPLYTINGNGQASGSDLLNYADTGLGGGSFTSADAVSSTDGDGNTTLNEYNSFNQPWCTVEPAEVANGVTCPPLSDFGGSPPSSPPSPGTYSYDGVTLNYYNSSDQLIGTTDPLGNTTAYAYTGSGGSEPEGLQYCTVSPVEYAKSVSCPSYGTTEAGAQTETFDSSGDVLTTTDADGDTTTNTYSGSLPGRVATTTDPDGQVTTYTYDAASQVTEQAVTFRSYAADTLSAYSPTTGRLYCTVAPLEAADSVTCPAETEISSSQTSLTMPQSTLNVLTTTGFSSTPTLEIPTSAGLQTVTCTGKTSTTFTGCSGGGTGTIWVGDMVVPSTPGATLTFSDPAGRTIASESPIGGITLDAYDDAGNEYCTVAPYEVANGVSCPSDSTLISDPPTVGDDPYPGTTLDTYNSIGQLTQSVNPLGGITTYTYDAAGQKLSQTVNGDGGSGDPAITTDYTYDADGHVTQTTVAPSTGVTETTETSYDPDGNAFCTMSAKEQALASTDDYQCPTWTPSWIAEPPSPTSLYSSSPSSSQANGVTTSFYNADQDLVQQSAPNTANDAQSTTTSAFDANGNAYCSMAADNFTLWLAFHPSATWPYACPSSAPTTPPSSGSNPLYTTTIYDAAGRTMSSTDATGATTGYTYDADGNQLTVTDPGGNVTTNCYYDEDASGQCAYSSPAAGGTAPSLYSTTSPATQADSSGLVTTYTYFAGGATDTKVTPSATATDTYDAAGDLTSVTYSGLASGYTSPGNATYTYYADGSRYSEADATGAQYYTYNAHGQQTADWHIAASGTKGASTLTEYTYYPNGEGKTIQYSPTIFNSTPTATYTYDATGAEASVEDWNGNTTTFSHDADGNPSQTAFPGSVTVNTTTDLGDAVTAISSSSPSISMSYTRDSQELITAETDGGALSGSPTYGYDYDSRLSGASTEVAAPTYNAAGDPTETVNGVTQTFDAAGELTATAGPDVSNSYTLDSIGDRTTVTPVSGQTSTYSYDANGELTGVASTAPPNGQVAAGLGFSLTLKSDGTVWATGNNSSGELGNNSTTNSDVPVEVEGAGGSGYLSNIVEVAAGGTSSGFSMALDSSGHVWTWGDDTTAELGNGLEGSTHSTKVPAEVSGLSGIVAIAAGQNGAIAAGGGGHVWTWGGNYYGETGDGYQGTGTDVTTPVELSGLPWITQVAAGGSTTAAITSAGALYTWGYNADGELGINSSTTSFDTPQAVSTSIISHPVTQVSVGAQHTLALDSTGTVWATGLNSDDQLGYSGSGTKVFTSISGIAGSSIAAGGFHSVVEETSGTLVTFGDNSNGQLGNGNTTNEYSPQSTGITSPVAFAAGGYHTVVENADGTLSTFGAGSYGQLGNAGVTDEHSPVPTSGWNATPGQVSAGSAHTLLLKGNGTVWASGLNSSGQLGNSSTTSSDTPVAVTMGSGSTGLDDATQISAGGNFSLALKTDGTVWAWGDDTYGQLANGHYGSSYSSDVPTKISGLSSVVAISAGNESGYALTSAGKVYSWGDDTYGELGNATHRSTPYTSATQISTSYLPASIVDISGGAENAMALSASGTVYAWGDNSDGQIGNGTTSSTPTTTPTSVTISGISGQAVQVVSGNQDAFVVDTAGDLFGFGNGSDDELGFSATNETSPTHITSVTQPVRSVASSLHTLVATTGGQLFTFGDDQYGQLGVGIGSNRYTPQDITSLVNVTSIAAGAQHTVVLTKGTPTEAGTAGTFGYNSNGQLGNGDTTNEGWPVQVSSWSSYTPVPSTSYTYNADGLRITKTTGSTTGTFAWDTAGSTPEILSDGINDYIYGPDGQVVEQVSESSNASDYYITDALGSTRALTNQSGTVVATYTYDPMGNVISQTGTVSTPIEFAGGYEDAETGLLYLEHRYYDLTTGTFLTLDPDVSTTMQPYEYAGDDSINNTDPSGDKLSHPYGNPASPQNATTNLTKTTESIFQSWLGWSPATTSQNLSQIPEYTDEDLEYGNAPSNDNQQCGTVSCGWVYGPIQLLVETAYSRDQSILQSGAGIALMTADVIDIVYSDLAQSSPSNEDAVACDTLSDCFGNLEPGVDYCSQLGVNTTNDGIQGSCITPNSTDNSVNWYDQFITQENIIGNTDQASFALDTLHYIDDSQLPDIAAGAAEIALADYQESGNSSNGTATTYCI